MTLQIFLAGQPMLMSMIWAPWSALYLVSADLAVHTVLEGSEPRHVVAIQHGGALPELGHMKVNLYVGGSARGSAVERLADLIRQAYRAGSREAEASSRDFLPALA